MLKIHQALRRQHEKMYGKTVIVTGAGSGMGLETADALARMGASLILIEIDPIRGGAAVERIGKNGARPRLFIADLSQQAEVRRVAGEILESTPRIDVLVNNAGAMFSTRQVTADGLERTFALNHMGYFLLTCLLLDRVIESSPARIVSVASGAHFFIEIDFDDLQAETAYIPNDVYKRSKLCNVLFTRALSRRLQGTGVTANCLDPGMVHSRFFENATGEIRQFAEWARTHGDTPAVGAETAIYLASSPEVEGHSGHYFVKCKVATPSEAAQNDCVAEQLWTESLKLVGTQTVPTIHRSVSR